MEKRNIGGLHFDITSEGLHEKVDLINKALTHYQQAEQLLEQARQISVNISMEASEQTQELLNSDEYAELIERSQEVAFAKHIKRLLVAGGYSIQ